MAQSINAHTVKAFINTEKTLDKLVTPTNNTVPEYEKIKHTLTGSQRAVTITIQVLHQLGYALFRLYEAPFMYQRNSLFTIV